MKEGRFSCFNPINDDAEIQSQLQLSQLIFATDADGNPVDGCALTIEERLDDDHIRVFIRTTDEVWAMAGDYPILQLLEMKLTCSQCGKEWWGLPTESGLCAECAPTSEPESVGEELEEEVAE